MIHRILLAEVKQPQAYMIYLTQNEIEGYYGKFLAGPGFPIENEDEYKDVTDNSYKYRFGFMRDHCIYSIIVKKTGFLSLPEAASFRALNGSGAWTFMLPEQRSEILAEIFNNRKMDLGWSYSPAQTDKYTSTLFCSHQKNRTQLVIWHPKFHVDLTRIAKLNI